MEFWPEFLGHDGFREFVAGGIGGMAGVVAGHPLDTLRIRIQQPQQGVRALRPSSLMKNLIRSEGVLALFKGLGPPLATVALQNAVTFHSYGAFARLLEQGDRKREGKPLGFERVAVAGAMAGLVQTSILTPVDLIKIRLQLLTQRISLSKSGKRLPSVHRTSDAGPTEILRAIVSQEGIRGLYRGLGITILRDSPALAIYFSSYEFSRELLHPGCRQSGEEGLLTMLTAGGMAGVLSWLAVYPLDVIKSRLQAQSHLSGIKYHGIVDCFRRSVGDEGWVVLWRGLGTTLLRAYLVNGAIFAAYELSLRSISPMKKLDVGF